MRNDINLRDEFSELVTDYGIWVLLQRNSRRIRCSCWSEKYQEGLSTHAKCGGTGWLVRLERHRARRINATVAISEPNQKLQGSFGKVVTNQYRWFFKHDVYPKPGDIIYEVNWDPKRLHIPLELVTAHDINTVNDERGDDGRIEYFIAAARVTSSNIKARDLIVRSMGPIKDYQIGGGKLNG